MVEIAIPFNRRRVQFARRRQHLVNHGLQRGVNHSRRTSHHYVRLTQNIKRIPTRFCHDCRVTRHKSRARESFEASMRSGGCAGSGRALRLDPFGLPVRFSTSDAVADGGCAISNSIVSASCCGVRYAACAWPSICRSLLLTAFHCCRFRPKMASGSALTVVLKHRDPALTLPLFMTSHPGEALAEWRAWSQVLSVPLLVANTERDRSDAVARAARPTSASPPATPKHA